MRNHDVKFTDRLKIMKGFRAVASTPLFEVTGHIVAMPGDYGIIEDVEYPIYKIRFNDALFFCRAGMFYPVANTNEAAIEFDRLMLELDNAAVDFDPLDIPATPADNILLN